ncbi:MAG TPA: serine/threonine-protein kinase [Polyangiaceae bacterium]
MTTPLVLCAQCKAPLGTDERVCPRCRALQPTRDSFVSGVQLDRGDARLVLDAPIGEGGMGVVWRAWLFRAPGTPGAGEGEPVALKVLRAQLAARTEARDLFLREAEALRRLSHPNVVGYNDLFEYEGSLVLSIEYVVGDTLGAIVARHVARAHLSGGHGLPCMPFLRAWYYFQQLLGALAAIHAMGIVHRDVKPSNVLVRRDGLVKLGDFGIARLADLPVTAATRELAPGTGAYMAPEQVLSRPLDGRTDLYAAAIVLYEMLAGKPPFSPDRGEFLVRNDQVDAPVPPIRAHIPQAPPVLDALFARALAKDPAHRFDNAIEMGDAFRAALSLPDTPEWRAQADIAVAARAIAQTRGPDPGGTDANSKLATLREFVAHGYKTMKLASM